MRTHMRKLVSTCYRLIEGHRLSYLMSLLSQILMVFFTVLINFMTKVMVDTIQGNLESAVLVEEWVILLITGGQGIDFLYKYQLQILPTSIAVTAILLVLASFLRMSLRSYTAAMINGSMQWVVFSHLQAVGYGYFKRTKPGDLIQTCTRDIDITRKFLVHDVSGFNYSFWIILFCFSILMALSWKMTLISVSLFPLLFLYSFLLVKKVRKLYRATDDSEALMTGRIQENLNAARIVKAFNAERKEIDGFEKYLDDYRVKFINWRKFSSFFYSSGDIFTFGSNIMTLMFGIYFCYTGEINAGTLVLAFLFINMMVWPLRETSTSLSNLGQYIASIDRIRLIIDEPIEDVTSGETPEINGNIVFDKVGFKFEDGTEETLKDVSFEMADGMTVAIMGKTGSGKSTLSLLLTRLYDYTSGSITVNGVELKDIQKRHLRKSIVPVLQDPFLFSKSIEENILMGRKNATKEEIRRAAKIASIDETITRFKDGYDTPVGEKGMSLSGGQKQRVAIARTIVSEAPIVIFDDSLSAVDTETDMRIRENLKEMQRKKMTSIIITHRVSTAKDADLILVLENGTIAQKGTHDELLKEEGLYQRIAKIQRKMA